MNRKKGLYLILGFIIPLLTGCLGSVWTGANLVYDRHNLYKKLNDYQLAAEVQRYLFSDRVLKQQGCSIDLAVINGDVLLAGHVPNESLKLLIKTRLAPLRGYRELFNFVTINDRFSSSLLDGWITGKIRAQILADSEIDPNSFKIITVDKVVYIMGDVRPREADKVINIARQQVGVIRVVKLMRYYHLSDSAFSAK